MSNKKRDDKPYPMSSLASGLATTARKVKLGEGLEPKIKTPYPDPKKPYTTINTGVTTTRANKPRKSVRVA